MSAPKPLSPRYENRKLREQCKRLAAELADVRVAAVAIARERNAWMHNYVNLECSCGAKIACHARELTTSPLREWFSAHSLCFK